MRLSRVINRIYKFISDKNYRFLYLADYGFYKKLSDEEFLKRKFYASLGYNLNLDNPRSFNEKLQWLKLNGRDPLYTSMVDKYIAKEYVSQIIGEEYVIPTLAVWETPEQVDFRVLPNEFVLKTTHDSGGVVICKNKQALNEQAAISIIKRSFNNDYFAVSREWPYKNVKRRVIAEAYMKDSNTDQLTDYKFMCFNGECKCIFTGTDRFSNEGLHITFYDKEWNIFPFERHYPAHKIPGPKPHNLKKMIELAERLAKGLSFVRIDFYEVDEKIYFGEITFFPGSGYEEFTPIEWDYKLGEWLKLPEKQVSI